ncbi:response regulator transcription factor [Aquimarina latercula]|uniref:response regulator transcription factor n=1 Tax=Aquimarina latercula TaxID=987 RepID=UPI00048127E4|nr:response regulator [Aquimarina latercula]
MNTKTILLIENDIALRENVQELLELYDHKVITAANGAIGIALANKEKFDIILCDIMMPQVDGYSVFNTLRNNSNTSQIPFVFCSAKTENKEIKKGLEGGVKAYLKKPFEE